MMKNSGKHGLGHGHRHRHGQGHGLGQVAPIIREPERAIIFFIFVTPFLSVLILLKNKFKGATSVICNSFKYLQTMLIVGRTGSPVPQH